MNLEDRAYQNTAISKILWSQSLEGNDLCVLPTGSGKSIVIAKLAKELKQPILVLQPSREILEQNYKKLCLYVSPKDIGIYSASLNQKDIRYFTFATIQSIYQKPEEFKDFKVVIVDECHLINPKNQYGMFTKFLKDIGSPKVIGLTATPYRMGIGYRKDTYGNLEAFTATKLINRMKEMFWRRIIFNINNKELLDVGYLSPLEYFDKSVVSHQEIPLNKTQSDFDIEGLEKLFSERKQEIIRGVQFAGSMSKSVLVFCSSIRQATWLQSVIPDSALVTGETEKTERARTIEKFKLGLIKYVFNVGVLTTGFDHPELDGIVLLRPTRSIALYYQMLGRGVRVHPNKKSCKVVDMTSTVENLGHVESIRLERVDGKWELLSDTGSWHNTELYSFIIKKAEPPVQEQIDLEVPH